MTNQQRHYDHTRLVVWPEWASSGIWHPEVEGEAVQMVSHQRLGLPEGLASQFDCWITRYDDFLPDYPDDFPWEDYRREGLVLAIELARFVGDKYRVEYNGEPVIVLP